MFSGALQPVENRLNTELTECAAAVAVCRVVYLVEVYLVQGPQVLLL